MGSLTFIEQAFIWLGVICIAGAATLAAVALMGGMNRVDQDEHEDVG